MFYEYLIISIIFIKMYLFNNINYFIEKIYYYPRVRSNPLYIRSTHQLQFDGVNN